MLSSSFTRMIPARGLMLAMPALAVPMLIMLESCDKRAAPAPQPGIAASGTANSTASGAENPAPTGQAPASTIDRSHYGAPIPNLVFAGENSAKLQLQAIKGPLLVNYWATWCAPCVTELPSLYHLAQHHGAKQGGGTLRVIAVSEDVGAATPVRDFWAARHFGDWPLWRDPGNTATGLTSLPTTILYDSAGHELWRVIGPRDWTSPASATLLAEAKPR